MVRGLHNDQSTSMAHIPYANTAKYLGMILDTKLRWKGHIKMKRDELNIKFREMATWTQLRVVNLKQTYPI
jgi:hypothetical protein